MLVLSRRLDESLRIGSAIEITVVSISRGRVKLGIRAPEQIRIVRSELTSCSPGVTASHEINWTQHARGA